MTLYRDRPPAWREVQDHHWLVMRRRCSCGWKQLRLNFPHHLAEVRREHEH